MNYYSFHIGDYLTQTAHLSLLEHGAYRRLLDVYYSTEQPLPVDPRAVHRLVMARSKEEKEAVDAILSEFFEQRDDGWHQHRADHEIALCDKNRDNGKKGGRPRKRENPDETQTEPINNPNETQTKPKQNPDETQTEPNTKAPITHYPLPNTQRCKQPSSHTDPEDGGTTSAGDGLGGTLGAPGKWLVWFNREHGLSLDPSSQLDRKAVWPIFTRWAKAGVTIEQVQQAIERARQTATEPIVSLPAYVDRVLSSQQAPPRPHTANSRQQRIDDYAAQAAAARGEQDAHGNRAVGAQERDITGESVRVA